MRKLGFGERESEEARLARHRWEYEDATPGLDPGEHPDPNWADSVEDVTEDLYDPETGQLCRCEWCSLRCPDEEDPRDWMLRQAGLA